MFLVLARMDAIEWGGPGRRLNLEGNSQLISDALGIVPILFPRTFTKVGELCGPIKTT